MSGILGMLLIGATPQPTVNLINVQALSRAGIALGGRPVELFVQGQSGSNPAFTSRTNAKGSDAISISLSRTMMSMAQRNGGYLNFDLVIARNNQSPLTYAFTRYVGSDSGNTGSGTSVHNSLVGSETSVILQSGRRPRVDSVEDPTISNFQSSAVPNSGICDYVKGTTSTSTAWMTIGEMHNAKDSTATFTYGQTADSTVEVGYSPTGSSWTSDGTSQVSNTVSSSESLTRNSSQWYDQGWQLTSLFTFTKTEYIGENACAGRVYYLLSASQWDGGFGFGRDESSQDGVPNKWTTPFPAGSEFQTSTAKAYTYSAAVSVFGATLSATSGYSTFVGIQWTFSGFTQYLYGNDGYPPSASIIYAD
jgi:hypothetical protein